MRIRVWMSAARCVYLWWKFRICADELLYINRHIDGVHIMCLRIRNTLWVFMCFCEFPFVSPWLYVCVCVCVSSYWMSHYWHLHSRLTHHIETFPNSEGLVLYLCFNRMSISCLKSGILSGAPSSRNQRWGGAARSCRFRDLPLSSDTHCCWIILLISEFSLQRSGLGRFENISTTIMLAWDRLILSLERKRWQSLASSDFFPPFLHFPSLFVRSETDETEQNRFGCHAVRAEMKISDGSVSLYIIISLTNSCGLQIACIHTAPPSWLPGNRRPIIGLKWAWRIFSPHLLSLTSSQVKELTRWGKAAIEV